MNYLLVKRFNGMLIFNFIWKKKPCWVAIDVTRVIGYVEGSNIITACIKREYFKEGREYEVLKGKELKKFKELAGDKMSASLKFAPKLIIFYEEGLYGFLQYTEKPIGITFRTWIRLEVMPELSAKGAYIMEERYYQKQSKEDERNYYDEPYNTSNIKVTCEDLTNVRSVNMKGNSEVTVKDNNLNRSSGVGLHNKNVVEKIADNVIIFDKYLDGLSIADEDKFLFLVSLYKVANIDIDLSFITSIPGD
ncbi:MAG: BRO family protein [Sarcina sp.]